MQPAYGLIGIEEVTPFDSELSEDSRWIISLAELMKSHRDDFLKNGNRLYMPKEPNAGDP